MPRKFVCIALLLCLFNYSTLAQKKFSEMLAHTGELKINILKSLVVNENDQPQYTYYHIIGFDSSNKYTTVVILPDVFDSSNALAYYVESFAKAGYDIIILDRYPYKDSLSVDLFSESIMGDYKELLKFAKKETPNNKILLWSLGSSNLIAPYLLSKNRVDYWVSESCIIHPSFYNNQLKAITGRDCAVALKDEYFIKQIHKIETPHLNFVGELDFLINSYESETLKEIHPASFQYKHKCGHLLGFNCLTEHDYGDLYIQNIEAFIQHH